MKTTLIPIPEPPFNGRVFLGSACGETGARYYTFTDPLGCTHLVSEDWGSWHRVSPEEVAAEVGRCAGIYAHQIEQQEQAGAPICTYAYMHERLSAYRRLYEAVSKAFPAHGRSAQ